MLSWASLFCFTINWASTLSRLITFHQLMEKFTTHSDTKLLIGKESFAKGLLFYYQRGNLSVIRECSVITKRWWISLQGINRLFFESLTSWKSKARLWKLVHRKHEWNFIWCVMFFKDFEIYFPSFSPTTLISAPSGVWK